MAAHQNPIVEKESFFPNYMGVSKNKGTPKWMIYNGKPYFLMDDLGVKPYFRKHPYEFLGFHGSWQIVFEKRFTV